MHKYITFYLGLLAISVSFVVLYFGNAPKVGPIGNGPNMKWIWFVAGLNFVIGSCGIGLSVLSSKRDDRKKEEK